jgi:hypothetical protein
MQRPRDAGAGWKGAAEMSDMTSISPLFIPIAGIIFGTTMTVAVVGIVFWFKARERELHAHQEMRLREMEHQRKMKELELEIEKTRSRPTAERVAEPVPE